MKVKSSVCKRGEVNNGGRQVRFWDNSIPKSKIPVRESYALEGSRVREVERVKAPSLGHQLERKAKPGLAALLRGAILQGEGSAVGFSDLTAERQSNPGPRRLGGEERHEKIRGVGKTEAVVFNKDFKFRRSPFPTYPDPAIRLKSSVNSIAQQINENLFQLISISVNHHLRAWHESDLEPRFQPDNALDQDTDIHRREAGLRET